LRVLDLTVRILTWPVDRRVAGVGLMLDVAPQPAIVSRAPLAGRVLLSPSERGYVGYRCGQSGKRDVGATGLLHVGDVSDLAR
jgi:hypothetical protein